MTYVDGFVIPVPKSKLATYRRFARLGKAAWLKHGALDYKECVLDAAFSQFPDEKGRMKKRPSQFPRMALAKKGETVIFAFIVFKSKSHRDRVNKKVMADPSMTSMDPSAMPVDMDRFGYAGFKVIVE